MITSPFSTTSIKLVNEEQDGQPCLEYNDSNHWLFNTHAVQRHVVIHLQLLGLLLREKTFQFVNY